MVIAENITPARITKLELLKDGGLILWIQEPGRSDRDRGFPIDIPQLKELFSKQNLIPSSAVN